MKKHEAILCVAAVLDEIDADAAPLWLRVWKDGGPPVLDTLWYDRDSAAAKFIGAFDWNEVEPGATYWCTMYHRIVDQEAGKNAAKNTGTT